MKKNGNCLVMVIMLLLVVVILSIMIRWTDSNLDWLLTFLSGKPINVPIWLSAVVTFVANAACFVFNIVISLLRLCVG
jgi:ABC-type sulfate transport system permease component